MRMQLILAFGLFTLIAVPVVADDGGFGVSRFSAQAPQALSDATSTSVIANIPLDPSAIEPAAGDEQSGDKINDIQNPVLKESEHKAAPIIIQKDMSVR